MVGIGRELEPLRAPIELVVHQLEHLSQQVKIVGDDLLLLATLIDVRTACVDLDDVSGLRYRSRERRILLDAVGAGNTHDKELAVFVGNVTHPPDILLEIGEAFVGEAERHY